VQGRQMLCARALAFGITGAGLPTFPGIRVFHMHVMVWLCVAGKAPEMPPLELPMPIAADVAGGASRWWC
jgi:hypothetical protein